MRAKRKRITPAHINHERWMVSYADFVTLLFAVFVVLFATAQQDRDSPRQISQAVSHALKNGSIREAIRLLLRSDSRLERPPAPSKAAPPELQKSLEALNSKLADEVASGKIDVKLDPRGLVVSLRQAAFFPSGQAALDPATYPIIEKLASVLSGLQNSVRLEGHTDAVPIRNSRFASNWELSAARSIAMLELLATRHGIEQSRLSIAGYAETEPLGSNEDPAGRAKNRRVDVVILNSALGAAAAAPPGASNVNVRN